MKTHYQTLGLSHAATGEEIRRAYRVLARRYHPDVNPGRASEERFKEIAHAYSVLSDLVKKKTYDTELEKISRSATENPTFGSTFDKAHAAYQRAGRASHQKPQEGASSKRASHKHQATPKASTSSSTTSKKASSPPETTTLSRLSREAFQSIQAAVQKKLLGTPPPPSQPSRYTVVEVSLSVFEAIRGLRKTIEVAYPEGEPHKVSVTIPPGARPGTVIRFRRKDDPSEEIIVIARVASHPFISISVRGLTVEVPVSVSEAIAGTKITVPSLGEPLLVTVEPGTQSGSEVRVKNKGILYRDGTRGDLFIRFLVKIPANVGAFGLKEKAADIDEYYETPVRSALPKSILDS